MLACGFTPAAQPVVIAPNTIVSGSTAGWSAPTSPTSAQITALGADQSAAIIAWLEGIDVPPQGCIAMLPPGQAYPMGTATGGTVVYTVNQVDFDMNGSVFQMIAASTLGGSSGRASVRLNECTQHTLRNGYINGAFAGSSHGVTLGTSPLGQGQDQGSPGIESVGCQNLTLLAMTVTNVAADGIVTRPGGTAGIAQTRNRNIIIGQGCVFSGCGRDGFAMLNGTGIYTDGTNTWQLINELWIDIEPDDAYDGPNTVVFGTPNQRDTVGQTISGLVSIAGDSVYPWVGNLTFNVNQTVAPPVDAGIISLVQAGNLSWMTDVAISATGLATITTNVDSGAWEGSVTFSSLSSSNPTIVSTLTGTWPIVGPVTQNRSFQVQTNYSGTAITTTATSGYYYLGPLVGFNLLNSTVRTGGQGYPYATNQWENVTINETTNIGGSSKWLCRVANTTNLVITNSGTLSVGYRTITNAVANGTTATVTLNASSPYANGDFVTLVGLTGLGVVLNGTWTCTGSSGDTFTFATSETVATGNYGGQVSPCEDIGASNTNSAGCAGGPTVS